MKTVETRSKCRDHIVHIIYDDTVDHVLHLDKLKVYGFASEKMKWFQSYLADRHQLVYKGSCVSDMALMKHGIPQGRVLGPLVFTVFINDMPLQLL